MGTCASADADSAEDKEIAKKVEEQKDKDENKIKLLLLGAGESGKSTIFKQMKILYGEPTMNQDDLNLVRSIIYNNTITTMQTILEYCETFELKGQATWDRRSDYQIVESLKYYFKNILRISEPGYMNKDEYTKEEQLQYQQDALLARVRTSGIVTEAYNIDGKMFEMYDVGGQRNERRKWIHCFENVTAVIFVAAISEYNQKLFEDATTNRMLEALEIFEEINQNKFFVKASMILFLNKRDLFEDKIKKYDIKDSPGFSDYTGGCDYDAGCAYFVGKFMRRKGDPDKVVYHHITCATDTSNVAIVFNSCKQIILQKNMENAGFM
ncbi:hypothetical protein JL722_2541 [Aureococcus anophagefferens]|nr:hypothetical protein JL722_2541 [Aureococcus anophagefferens]